MKGTITMRPIDRHKPTSLFNIVGNQKAIAKICRVADNNNGYDGLAIMLTGRTGNGKTLIADLIAKMVTDEPYRADCTKEAETKALIDQMKRNVSIQPMFSPLSVYIFDEVDRFQFYPGLYEEYLVPWHVLIEGRKDDHPLTKWELMDEYTLEHFSARAHVYFSYPRQVKFIRITVQDWYGSTMMEDIRKDWFYPFPNGDRNVAGDHWGEYSNLYANRTVRMGNNYTVGRCLDELPVMPVSGTTPDFRGAREEWQKWRQRTIQSLWKEIYIPPFLFFGDNGER
jgi:hypothetical protein